MKGLWVQMNEDEVAVANLVADRRNTLNHGDRSFTPETEGIAIAQDQAATLAEMAVAKYYNRYWSGCGKGVDGLRDVAFSAEVRSVRKPHHGLIVRPHDEAECWYFLVYVEGEYCHIVGRAKGVEAKQEKYWQVAPSISASGYWLVPQEDLLPPWRVE